MPDLFSNCIDGEWVETKSGKTFPNVNPANTERDGGEFSGFQRRGCAGCV